MGSVFHRHCSETLPTVSFGEGVYLVDSEGRYYLDGCGGAAVSNLGHNHPRIKAAIQAQLETIAYAHTGFFTSESSEKLAERIVSLAPHSLQHVYFVSGGSEAVEAALKMARQYYVERGMVSKTEFIARRQSYHGNTLGALAVGGNEWRREAFRPLLSTAHHIAPCYAYRDQLVSETEGQYSQRMANELEAKILELGAENVMAFVAEPVVGATAGAVPATQGYLQRVREICDQYDVLLILDEVMCGVGRTGTFFAFEQDQVTPDMVTMAKGLGAGYQPIGAVLVHEKIYQEMANGTGFFQHGHTFMGHPMACAAALATVETIIEDDLLTQVVAKGCRLKQKLSDELQSLDMVGDIRGRGLFIGIELVSNKRSKAPLAIQTQAHKWIKSLAMENGLMCYPMAGTIDGVHGHHILLAPPFIISEIEMDELVGKLKKTLVVAQQKWATYE
ncbi:Adenosylmethionine-8-amino-7-oxononanoate aminotransferase [Vibrio thalassae]|uniref:Adenosylmethionine-8-amino-7-oxononanoate aminotransferase n=1 Tax=Vibrio thalassae TaxID=1243014 RepID=A0A240EP26_9VIBR|nr:aspartate aminotransferase family protein [Vibrio thalassae]SNX49983.1 Adenosylmethionine-8-amino-7-oxononanoate aminotransferase [Vibrio thalassae]